MSRLASVLLLLAACGGDSAQDTGLCEAAPVVTYANFGEGFMTQNCQSCHASTAAAARNGAPESVTFDTYDDVLAHADRILARSAGADASMPPSGGVSEDDRYLLEVWLTCWEQ